MRNYMRKLTDKLTALGYAVGNIQSKILSSGFSFEVNGTRILVTDKELKDVDSVVEYVVNHINKEEKMKTVTETLKALVQDLDDIDNVVFGEHKGAISVNSNNNNFNKIVITIDDHDEDVITAHVMINGSVKGIITSWVYKDLLEFIESYLNGTNELDAIGAELVGYLKIDDYEVDHSMIKITLPNNREMKIECVQENIYNIAYHTWDCEYIKTDSVKNLAKIIVLKYIYNL